MKIPFFRLSECSREKELVGQVLDSGWLTTGKMAAQLEARFAEYCKVEHALAVNSCTAALHLAVEALGLGPGDQVAVPSLTFTATAEVIRYVGADPVLMDMDPDTLLVGVKQLEGALEQAPNIKTIIPVHIGGQPVKLTGPDGLIPFCESRGIKIIQDAAHAFPCLDTYGPVGHVGDVSCFSFYANKTITTGEGGMLVTNDSAIADRVKKMRLHGIDRDVFDRFTGKSATSWSYDVIAPGFKYNMPDINAAIGIAQFDKAWEFRDRREAIAKQYYEALSDWPELRLVQSRIPSEDHAWHLVPIVLTEACSLSRNDVIQRLTDQDVGTSVHYRPLHRMSYYAEKYDLSHEDFPNTEYYWQNCISLPIYPAMSDADVAYVIDALRNSLG